ncbi:hypothetical protein [Scatolibacter rhodanostii]|uniref:hypothetical protein n=1 Tax=Scatolibacter rhodanostii TaxID=2014781 RepID=UPI000C08083D|nr:hypothetical protein [Scatolibacter rhodanostii]
MRFLTLCDEMIALFQNKIEEVAFHKAYEYQLENLSVRQINVSLKLLNNQHPKEQNEVNIESNFFVPQDLKTEYVQDVFSKMCKVLEEYGWSILKVSKGKVLLDEDLGLSLFPCTISVQQKQTEEKKSYFWLQNIRCEADSIQISAVRSQKEFTAFGENIPFGTSKEKVIYSVTFKGFDGLAFEEYSDFVFIPDDESGFGYFGCSWSKYSLTDHEFTLISADRRKLV